MPSAGAHLLFLAVICTSAGSTSSFVSVACKINNIGQYGGQSKLECVVQTAKDVKDPEIVVLIWKKVGVKDPVLFYDRDGTTKAPRFEFAESSWNYKNMDVSLLVSNTVVTDAGDYECTVITDSGDGTHTTKLSVTAKYSEPTIKSIPTEIIPNTDISLLCHSNGGYPEGKLRWFDEHNVEWTKSSTMEAKQTADGLFRLSSELTLLRGSVFSKYTCSVHNASGGKEGQAAFDTIPPLRSTGDQSSTTSKVVAPVVVIGSLIIGLLLMLLWGRRKWRPVRRQSAAPLMGNNIPQFEVEKGEADEFCEPTDLREGTQ